MAAEGAIAMKKKILSMFSLHFRFFFFEKGFRILPLERWTEENKQKKCGLFHLI